MPAPQTLIKTRHDKEHDILYLIAKDGAIAESEPVFDGVYVRRDIHTDAIVGFVVERYSERDRDMLAEILRIDRYILPS